jgi:hypothetical protein
VSTDPDYLLIQADQQLCQGTVPGIYCNVRGIIKTQGHIVEVQYDQLTVDGQVTTVPIGGTLQVGNGVNVTHVGTNNYIVNFPNGNVQFTSSPPYSNIYITLTSGRVPTGNLVIFLYSFKLN